MKGISFIIGVDIGGTFTDVICFDPQTSRVEIEKVPTTWPDPSVGMVSGICSLVKEVVDISSIIHGTTIATNAILERKGSNVGLITTKGFRDVLEMRRRQRPHTYGLTGEFIPLVPRHFRLEVDERVRSDGVLQTEINDEEFRSVAKQLLEKGAESIAVCFINSFLNSKNEERAFDLLNHIWPNKYISVSTHLLPEIKEFERTSTTVLNAYIQPVLDRYLGGVETKLVAQGYRGQISVVQSNGGIASVAMTREKPVTTILSGPAAGVTAANYIAKRSGINDIVTFDMGGTSLDAAVVIGNQPYVTSEATVEFGIVIKIPMIQITTIGAGGGSIASIDRGGFMRVGPESAGSVPGPVAYDRGGTRPTVTDANLVMGRINTNRPIGRVVNRFYIDAAVEAISEHIGRPLQLETIAAANAILRVANTNMAGAVRLVTVEKGYDPRRFTLVAFGGAGPLHAAAVIKEVGIPRVLIPFYPGLTSALGCVVGNEQYDLVQTVNILVETADLSPLFAVWDEQKRCGLEMVSTDNGFVSETRTAFSADMQYEGQTHAILVEMGGRPTSRDVILNAFKRTYYENYGINLNLPVKLVSVRTTVIGLRQDVDISSFGDARANRRVDDALIERRDTFVEGHSRSVPVYERVQLPRGGRLRGPAIIEQADSTVFVEPEMDAVVDDNWNLTLEVK